MKTEVDIYRYNTNSFIIRWVDSAENEHCQNCYTLKEARILAKDLRKAKFQNVSITQMIEIHVK